MLDPVRVGDVLATLEADVIGLQEVDWRHPGVAGRDQLAYLAERLGMHPIAGPNLRDHRGEYGNGLLTKLPASGHGRVDLSVPGQEPRGAIDAHLGADGFSLRVLVTHLGLARAERAQQVAALRAHLDRGEESDAVLLVGDLNEWRPRPFAGRALTPRPFPTTSRSRSFPSRRPVLALDRILALPEPRRFEARAIRAPLARVASDHLPVIADIEWP